MQSVQLESEKTAGSEPDPLGDHRQLAQRRPLVARRRAGRIRLVLPQQLRDELVVTGPPPSAEEALRPLGSALATWFRSCIGEPTAIQRHAWPILATGRHTLLSAATGTGKTLAAFLPALAQLLAEKGTSAGVCLYLAPLRSLVNDMVRTLQAHLDSLARFVPAAAELQLAVRTGDTPAAQRRALRRQLPALVFTTPESLAVLLSQAWAEELFANLRWVVVDEVHALAPTKRGADLAVSLERITALAGESLQRIGLSATATPAADVARWLAGSHRGWALAQVEDANTLELRIDPLQESGHLLADLVQKLAPELHRWRTTLVFTNTRRLAEQLAWALRRNFPFWDAHIGVHHSSMAASRRRAVEEAFKAGQLRAVISSTSLELGIDIGPVDLVVLVHPPGAVLRLLQRVGRSGHGPGRVRRGLVLTAGTAELLEAVVTSASGQQAQWEPLRQQAAPLDILCQQLVGMACVRTWSADEAFALVCRATPYAQLQRQDFDDCLDYLLGVQRKSAEQGAVSWLPGRLVGDGSMFAIRNRGTARLLSRNLGSIVEEPWVGVRSRGSEFPEETEEDLGQVDEAFADAIKPGDRFVLGGQCLEVRHGEAGTLWVQVVTGKATVPRWGGERWPLSTELAARVYLLRVRVAEALRDGRASSMRLLQSEYGLAGPVAELLVGYFEQQECVSEIPDASTALVEVVSPPGGAAAYYWHTPLNRLGNDALARVATHRLARDWGCLATVLAADLGFALLTQTELPAVGSQGQVGLLRALLSPIGFAADLEASLQSSEALRTRFGQVAQTGLMLLRNPLGRRRKVGGPDWAARRLFDQVKAREPQFVLLRQARRELMSGVCHAAAGEGYAEALPHRTLRCRRLMGASPFAVAWTQAAMGIADAPVDPTAALQRLRESLIGSRMGSAGSGAPEREPQA